MKKHVSLFLVLLMLVTLVACASTPAAPDAAPAPASEKAPDATPAPAAPEKASLRIFHHFGEQVKKDGMQNMCDAFSALHPEVEFTIEFMDFNDYIKTVKLQIAADNAPDFIHVRPANVPELVYDGHILAIDPAIVADCVDATLPPLTIDGKVYGAPLDIGGLGIFYNKKMFADNGFSVPTTLTEFENVMKGFQDKGIVPLTPSFNDNWTMNLIFEPDYFSYQLHMDETYQDKIMKGEANFSDNPEMPQMLERIATMVKYYGPDPFAKDHAGCMQSFANEEYPMLVLGNWGIGEIRKYNPDGEFGFFAGPVRDSNNVFQAGVDDCLMVSSHSKAPEAAVEFLKYLMSPDANKIWADTTMNVPSLKGVSLTKPDSMIDDITAYMNNGMAYFHEKDIIFYGDYYDKINKVLQDYAVACIEGKKPDTVEYLKGIDKEFEAIRAMS